MMVDFGQGTRIPTQEELQGQQEIQTPQQRCEASGGFWDVQTQTCVKVPQKPTPSKLSDKSFDITTGKETKAEPELSDQEKIFRRGGAPLDIPRGVPLTTEQSKRIASAAEFEASKGGQLSATEAIRQQQAAAEQQQIGLGLAGQVGQFGQLGAAGPGGIGEFDYQEAAIAGLRTSIPSAIGGAAAVFTAGTLGASIAAGAGTLAAPGIGTVIGGVLGFAAGITAGILSNMNSQRTDTTSAQQRVLDEGKQTLQDWATMARSNPARKREAVAGFNAQLALIDQAYRQMKFDTMGDVLKFETALPNLAEFESFYNLQGERDFLMFEMRQALTTLSDPSFDMVELARRYQ